MNDLRFMLMKAVIISKGTAIVNFVRESGMPKDDTTAMALRLAARAIELTENDEKTLSQEELELELQFIVTERER